MRQANNQINLFNDRNYIHDHRTKRHHKHSRKHWTYERRLANLISHHKDLSWKIALHLSERYLDGLHNGERLNHGHLVNQWQLKLGVRAMHSYRKLTPAQRQRSSRSVAKIARTVHVSRHTLYRAYYRKYGK